EHARESRRPAAAPEPRRVVRHGARCHPRPKVEGHLRDDGGGDRSVRGRGERGRGHSLEDDVTRPDTRLHLSRPAEGLLDGLPVRIGRPRDDGHGEGRNHCDQGDDVDEEPWLHRELLLHRACAGRRRTTFVQLLFSMKASTYSAAAAPYSMWYECSYMSSARMAVAPAMLCV